jgi:phage FluMu gp28-like protein
MVVTIHLRTRIVKLTEREIVLVNLHGGRSTIRAKSADNTDSLLGEGLDWVIVDEAARLKPEIWQSHLTQRLIDKKGWALLISTPRGKGWFFDMYRRGQDPNDQEHESWNLPSWSNPHLDREVIEKEREKLPERVFRQEFGGEFIEGEGSVFRYVRERATGDFQAPEKGQTYYAGLDLGRLADFTVLVIVNHRREVVFVDRFHKVDWAQQIARVGAACERYNQCRVWCDVTGVGDPIYEALRRAGVRANAYAFTQRSKAALIDNLCLVLEHQKLVLPRPEVWPEGIDELTAFEYSVTDAGSVRSSAPSGQHDDCVMALALAAIGVGFKDRASFRVIWV